MNEQKQTKRAKAKKIGAYVLIGILVCVFLASTLGNVLSASASDIYTQLIDIRSLSGIEASTALAIGADYIYPGGRASGGVLEYTFDDNIYEEYQIDYSIIFYKSYLTDFDVVGESLDLVQYFTVCSNGSGYYNPTHVVVYEYDTFYEFAISYSFSGYGYDEIKFDFSSCFADYGVVDNTAALTPSLYLDYQGVVLVDCDYEKCWFDTTFTYEDGVMRNDLEYVPFDMTNESYYILIEDEYDCFSAYTSDDDGTIDTDLMELIDSEFYGKISGRDTKYVLTNHMRGFRLSSGDRNIYAFNFKTQYTDSYFTYFGVEFGNIFSSCGWSDYLDGLTVLGVAVLENVFPDHTLENAVGPYDDDSSGDDSSGDDSFDDDSSGDDSSGDDSFDDGAFSNVSEFQGHDMKFAYMTNSDYKLNSAPEKTANDLIWNLPTRLTDSDYIEYSIVYDLDDLVGFDLGLYNSGQFSDYFYGIIGDDGAQTEFSDIVNMTVKDGYFIATFRCTNYDRGYSRIGFKWKEFFKPWLSNWSDYDVVVPLGLYVNYANIQTVYPSTVAYRTYAERVVVYGDGGAEKTQIKGFQNGNKFTCNYSTVFVGTNGKVIVAQDIIVKGWLVVNGGVDHYSYTLKNGTRELSHDAINMYADDFITTDVDKIGADGGYVCYNYNAQYQFCITRLFDPAYRGTDIDSIEIKAHLYDGTEITIFTISNVWFSEHGGFRCDACGNRLIKIGDYVSLSHASHKVELYCDVCCKNKVVTFDHYITDDQTNICNLCGGSGRFCTRFSKDVYSPAGMTYHERYTVCADCGKENTTLDSHNFNDDMVCIECGYVYENFATYDVGFTDGYAKALETMEYGYFIDARLTVYATAYDYLTSKETTIKKDFVIDNVSKGGLSFEKYVEFLIVNKNIDVRSVEIVIELTQPMEYFENCLFFTSTLVDGAPVLPLETSLVPFYSGDRIACEYKQASLTHTAIIADAPEKFYVQKIRFTVPTLNSNNLYTVFCTRELSIVSNVLLLGAKNAYYNEGYSDGRVSASEDVENSYNDGYRFGFAEGEKQGYYDGFDAGANSDDMFTKLFSGIFDSITLAFYSMLNFEIFGVNIAMFALSLITLALIIIVVKKFM